MKLIANYQHCRAKYRDFRPIQVNLQRQLQTCLARHKQLATQAIQEFWHREAQDGAGKRDQQVDYFELMSVDLNHTDMRLQTDREDGSFTRNAKNLFNLVILHDPLINKIILKMQENIIRDTDPEGSKYGQLASWYDYGDLLSETMIENGTS